MTSLFETDIIVSVRKVFRAKGPAFYAYSTIYFSGFSLFALITGLVMLSVTVRHIISPAVYNMLEGYAAINSASTRFMMLTTPVIVLFAAAMMVSNIATGICSALVVIPVIRRIRWKGTLPKS